MDIMVKPHFIPRSLRGVGGVRLFDIPGVVYPREMLVTKAGLDHKSGKPYTKSQKAWGVTTSEAADLLHCSTSAARNWLHRRKVPYRIVGEEGQSLRLFWRRERVIELAQQRWPVLRKRNSSLITSKEAQRILGIGRSSLYRYEQRGQLSVTKMRHTTAHGMRRCSYFKRAEVERLAKYLSSARVKEAEMRSFRRSNRPPRSLVPAAVREKLDKKYK